MKTLIFLTSIAAAEAALPLKNFPGNKRRLEKFVPTPATVTDDCSFSTLGNLLPDDTVEYAVFDTVEDKGYIGGVATRIQLSGKNGYNYYMRGSSAGGNNFKKFKTTFSYVQCHEIEDGTFSPTERTNFLNQRQAAHCGMKDSGIRKTSATTNDVTGGTNGKLGIDMELNTNPSAFRGYYVEGGICKSDFSMKDFDGNDHQIIAKSSCDAISGAPTIPDATYANGISIVTKTCGVTAAGNPNGDFSSGGCVVTIGEETIDIAVASKCGANGGRHSRAIGDVSEAFVWYRTTRKAVTYTIKNNDPDYGTVVSIDANGQQVNNWIGDILFTRPPHINPATDFSGTDETVFVTPSYVKRADSFVTFASNPTNVQTTPGDTAALYDGSYTNRCSVADPGTYEQINTFNGNTVSGNDAIVDGRWNCKAKLEATVTLVNKFVGACTPGAFLKSSLVQFARIHKTHMEVGTNVTKFASGNSMLHQTLGYYNRFNGAAEKYALIAMNQSTLPAAAAMTSEWQCDAVDKCKTGNPFVLLQYNEDAGIWDSNMAATNGEFTVETTSGFQNLIDPGTVYKDAAEQNLAAIAYTYVIGYVDFGYGCFNVDTTAADLIDEAKARRLAVEPRRLAVEPEEWKVHSQITFAGGHHIDID